MRWKVLAAACAALTAAACAAPSPETRFVQAGVLTEYSPAADLGVVMNGWAACKPGSQSWTSAPQKDGTTLVTFSCKAQDQLELNETIAEKSRTIRRMRTLFEFDDIRYRADFVVSADKKTFTPAGAYNDYVWKDGVKASVENDVLRLAYDGRLATDVLKHAGSDPDRLAFTLDRYVQSLGPAYLDLRGGR